MENQISPRVFARNNVEPKFPHEEHTVGGVDWSTCWTHTHTEHSIRQHMSKLNQIKDTLYFKGVYFLLSLSFSWTSLLFVSGYQRSSLFQSYWEPEREPTVIHVGVFMSMEMMRVAKIERLKKIHANLIMCFDKNAVAFRWGQTQLLGNVVDEVLDSGRWRHLKYLQGREK